MFVRHGMTLARHRRRLRPRGRRGLTRFMSSLLFGISPLDVTTYVAVSSILLTATVLASYLPAQRATAVSPVDTLRAE